MAEATIHVNDVGTAIEFAFVDEQGAVLSLASATALYAWFQRPDLTTVEKTAELITDGTDGLARYVSEELFFDQAGTWRAQGVAHFGADKPVHTVVSKFKVRPNIRSD